LAQKQKETIREKETNLFMSSKINKFIYTNW